MWARRHGRTLEHWRYGRQPPVPWPCPGTPGPPSRRGADHAGTRGAQPRGDRRGGTLYRHFPTKGDLVTAVMAELGAVTSRVDSGKVVAYEEIAALLRRVAVDMADDRTLRDAAGVLPAGAEQTREGRPRSAGGRGARGRQRPSGRHGRRPDVAAHRRPRRRDPGAQPRAMGEARAACPFGAVTVHTADSVVVHRDRLPHGPDGGASGRGRRALRQKGCAPVAVVGAVSGGRWRGTGGVRRSAGLLVT
jgi:AcrR family transcriptional regulator